MVVLYQNKSFNVESRKVSDDITVRGVSLGERGRGRFETFLPVPTRYPETSPAHERLKDYGIGLTKSNRPRIVPDYKSDVVCALLTSNGGYNRHQSGYIKILKDSRVQHIATGTGAWGDAGRVGGWTDAAIQFTEGWIQVTFSGHSGAVEYYGFCPDGRFRTFECLDDLIAAYDAAGWDLPFKFDPETRTVIGSDWIEAHRFQQEVQNG